MKVFFFAFAFMMCASVLKAQENPVKWQTKAEKLTENEYLLSIDGTIEEGWYIYSQYLSSDDGPVRTTITFPKDMVLIGKTEESGYKKEGFDEMFGMEVIKFSKHITFSQKVKIAANQKVVKANLNYMMCNQELCLPPRDVSVEIKL